MLYVSRILYLVTDIIFVALSYVIGLLLRFDWEFPKYLFAGFAPHLPVVILITVVVNYFFRLYHIIWKYSTAEEYMKIVQATIVSNILTASYILLFASGFPRSVLAIVFILEAVFMSASRILPKLQKDEKLAKMSRKERKQRTLIIGAGEAGTLVLSELSAHPELQCTPVAFLDDDPKKLNQYVRSLPVLGKTKDVKKVVEEENIDTIIVAIPSMGLKDRKKILDMCSETSAKVRIVPGYYQFMDGEASQVIIRDVEIEDLLGREPVSLDTSKMEELISGKVVMVDGAGGSIGSELCRQIAKYKPKKLLMLDIYENTTYDIQMELKRKYGKSLDFTVFIDSIRDKERLDQIFASYRPQVLFHAAAHKHVPLMEFSAQSAIKNNVFGTWNLATVADKYGVEKMVSISTDKAVNPTSVMGTTKRIMEMILHYFNKRSKTEYVAVRFGNVLGSHGSVIPLFRQQIKEGGPVTVTHEDIIRYFMTIPEACQLVMQAGAMAKGGEIFILDMGEPVRILDMAEKLIRLSGYEPYKDIDIQIVGLRPGEKLYEELILNTETATATDHRKIFIDKPETLDDEKFLKGMKLLEKVSHSEDIPEIRRALQTVVDTYHPYIPPEEKVKE